MEIREITEDKRRYMELLLLADEQESMVEKYLDKGDLFVLFDPDVKAVCVVTHLGGSKYEIKNIAVSPACQGQGLGRKMIDFVVERYRGQCSTLYVGTGDSPLTVPFYNKCGFTESHRVKNFFTDNYDHPIIECGVQLVDMVYLKREL